MHLLSTTQAARLLGLSDQAVRHLVRTGRLSRVKSPHGSLFEPSVIERLRRDRASKTAGSPAPAAVR